MLTITCFKTAQFLEAPGKKDTYMKPHTVSNKICNHVCRLFNKYESDKPLISFSLNSSVKLQLVNEKKTCEF